MMSLYPMHDLATWQSLATQLISLAESWQEALGERRLEPLLSAPQALDAVGSYDFREPLAREALIAALVTLLDQGTPQSSHPRYIGLLNSAVDPASCVSELLTAVFNPQLGVSAHTPAATAIGQRVLDHLKRKIGFPPESYACFTTGEQEANLAAAHTAFVARFEGYLTHGWAEHSQPVIYISELADHSFRKIAALVGIGHTALRRIPVTRTLELDLRALGEAVEDDEANGKTPVMVVATAGGTAAGSIDPLESLSRFCWEKGLWLHVDAAWGAAALLSQHLAVHLQGIDGANSVTWDAQQWLSVPEGAGIFFCRDIESATRAFDVGDASLVPEGEPGLREWGRRLIGLKVFMRLAAHGEAAMAERLEHQAQMADYLRRQLEGNGWKIYHASPLAVLCFAPADGYTRQDEIAALARQVNASGIAWISTLNLPRLGSALRTRITDFCTTDADVDRLIAALDRARSTRAAPGTCG